MSLMAEVMKAAGKWKKNATMADLRYGVAVVSGKVPIDCPVPHFYLKSQLVLLFERGEQVTVQVARDRLAVGITLMGNWVWNWNLPIVLDDRPSKRDIPGWAEALAWISSGERGLSSEAMCRALFGVPYGDREAEPAAPRDPDDLRRCRAFLDAVPQARERLSELATLSPTWKIYVEHWDQMNRLFDEEAPLGRLMKTSALMRDLQLQVG